MSQAVHKQRPRLKGDVREEAALLEAIGFEFIGMDGAGHVAFEHPDYGRKALPFSPSDHAWRKAHRRDTARAMGIPLAELERKMGVRAPKRSTPRPKRERNHKGREARSFSTAKAVKKETQAERDPRDELVREIQRQIHTTNTALPGSHVYERAIRELSKLRAKYLQLEADAA